MIEKSFSSVLYRMEKKEDQSLEDFDKSLGEITNVYSLQDDFSGAGIRYIEDNVTGKTHAYLGVQFSDSEDDLLDKRMKNLSMVNVVKEIFGADLELIATSIGTKQQIKNTIKDAEILDSYFENGIGAEIQVLKSYAEMLKDTNNENWVKHTERLVEFADKISERYSTEKFRDSRKHSRAVDDMRRAAKHLPGVARKFANTKNLHYVSRIDNTMDAFKQLGDEYMLFLEKAKIEAMSWDPLMYFKSDRSERDAHVNGKAKK